MLCSRAAHNIVKRRNTLRKNAQLRRDAFTKGKRRHKRSWAATLQIEVKGIGGTRYLLQSGTILFEHRDTVFFKLEEENESLTLSVEFEEEAAVQPGAAPRLKLEGVDAHTAKAIFLGPTPYGVTYGPTKLGTLANKNLTVFFSISRTISVATFSFAFWLEGERNG